MPTVKQALEYFRKAVKDGKGDMHTGHPFISEEEEQKREDNAPDAQGKQKTKISWDAADPDSYAEWHKERKRWMKAADKNPTLATDMMILALMAYNEEGIQSLKGTLMEQRRRLEEMKRNPAVPKASIPQDECLSLCACGKICGRSDEHTDHQCQACHAENLEDDFMMGRVETVGDA